MTNQIRVRLYDAIQAHTVIKHEIWPKVKSALQSGQRLILEVKTETRSLEQNRRLWAMLTDVSEQVDWHGRQLTPEEWKHVFTAALTKQDSVPGLDGGFVVLGKSTSKMTKVEMSELQELMAAFGAQQGVKFSEPTDYEENSCPPCNNDCDQGRNCPARK